MSSITLINNEYLYKFKLLYRKTLPKIEYFYILLYFTKYFPVILYTNAIYPNCPNKKAPFTLSKIIQSILIIHPPFNISYLSLCIFIYCLLIFLYGSIIFIFFTFYNLSKQTDYKLYNIPSNKIKLPTKIKKFFRVVCWIYLLCIFLYQHLVEILYYGVFELFASFVQPNKFSDNYFEKLAITRSYPIAALNFISLILLVMMMYFFYSLTMSSIMSNEYGFRGINSKVKILTQILIFSTQKL